MKAEHCAPKKLLLGFLVVKGYNAYIYAGFIAMTTAFNTQHEENRQMTTEEAFKFFDAAVRERLHISGQEFLQRKEEFKCNPHYETLMFMVPLTLHAAD